MLTWANCFDVPTTRLLAKYNSIQDKLLLIQATVIDDHPVEQASNESGFDDEENEFSYMNEEGYQIYTWGYKS